MFSGIRLGLLLALASIGLSLIYGTTGLSNFAHAEQVTMGGMLGFLVVNQWGVNAWLGCALVVVFCGFTGYLQDRAIWQPLRRRGLGLAQMMIVTIGLALALQYVYQYFIALRHGEDRARRAGAPVSGTHQLQHVRRHVDVRVSSW